ncbi:DUF5133 domain-containing protein [Streptomyces sp. GMR22]|nr:DUF5133 domain-containing protein [Streptomyces sp. GMR22]
MSRVSSPAAATTSANRSRPSRGPSRSRPPPDARCPAPCAEQRGLHAENGGPEAQQRLDDVSYTLCIATGTRDRGTFQSPHEVGSGA